MKIKPRPNRNDAPWTDLDPATTVLTENGKGCAILRPGSKSHVESLLLRVTAPDFCVRALFELGSPLCIRAADKLATPRIAGLVFRLDPKYRPATGIMSRCLPARLGVVA